MQVKWFLQDTTDSGEAGGAGGGSDTGLSFENSLDAGFTEAATGMGLKDTEDSGEASAAAPPEGKKDGNAAAGDKKVGAAPARKAVPKSWKTEWHPQWEALPDAVRDIVHAREDDFLNGAKTYEQDRTYARSLRDTIKPFEQLLTAQSLDAPKAVSYLLSAHQQLSNPATATAAVQKMLSLYNIDAAGLKTALEGAAANGVVQDPALKALTDEVNNLKGRLSSDDQRRLSEAKAAVESEVDAFAKDPLHPYFDEVSNDIAVFLRGSDEMTMQQAYDKAVWANEVTRAKETSRLQKETEETLRKEATKKADAARRSRGTQVNGQDSERGPTDLLGSMEDTMRETYRKMQAKH